MFLEIGLIENENGCPVNLVIAAHEIAWRITLGKRNNNFGLKQQNS